MLQESLQTMHTQFPWFFTGCFGLLGAMVGSFLNVCIYRVPQGRSVIHPGSQCACGAAIPWYRNIPVLAWFFLRGKAPCCGRRFSIRYPLVEALTAGLFAACWALLPWQQALAGVVLIAWLIVLGLIDLDTMMLPDSLNVGLALAGVVLSVALPGLHGETAHSLWLVNALCALSDSLTGLLVGAGLIYWFRLLASLVAGREAMGEGDIILLGGIGAFCGWQGAVFALFGGSVIGAVILLPLLLAQRLWRRGGNMTEKSGQASHAAYEGDEIGVEVVESGWGMAVPFGPWLALGAIAWFLIFREPFEQYIHQLCLVLSV